MSALLFRRLLITVTFALQFAAGAGRLQATDYQLSLRAKDELGTPLPFRVHLAGPDGRPVLPDGVPTFRDHFVCDGQIDLKLPNGEYQFAAERGPEFTRHERQLVLDADRTIDLTFARIASLRAQGWYSADLHVHRPVRDIELLMRAEDLDFAPVLTWWNRQNPWKESSIPDAIERQFDGHRVYHVMAGEDERQGGALLYFGLPKPVDITQAGREHPSPMTYLQQAHAVNADVWVDIEKPFWWDVPVWLASGQADSIGLANNHMCRTTMYEDEAWGRPRDAARLRAPLGNGFWTQEIYYHILNAGLRLPPSAGSASGVLPNPVGYNRVYVHLTQPFSREAWWEGLRAGHCFVSNGPLLLCSANKLRPGSVLQSAGPVRLDLQISLISADRVRGVELVHNGTVAQTFPTTGAIRQDWSAQVELEDDGWFLLRAIADVEHTFRFASTGPFYIRRPAQPARVSAESVRFFRDWVEERIALVKQAMPAGSQRDEVLQHHIAARQFWTKRLRMAAE